MERIKSGIILLLLGALIVSIIANLRHKHSAPSSGVIPSTGINSLIAAPIKEVYVDSAGHEHVVIDTKANEQIRREAVQVAAPIAAKIDSLAAALALKSKQVGGFTAVLFAASRDSLRFMQQTIDSLKRQTFFYKDKYLSLRVRTVAPADTCVKCNEFDFDYNADLKFVDYWRRRKVLGLRIGLRDYLTDISSSDPRMHIKGVDKFTVQRKMSPLGFRVQAISAYNFLSMGFSAGIGIRLDIGDLNTSVNYMYNFKSNQTIPLLLTRYNLVQFGR